MAWTAPVIALPPKILRTVAVKDCVYVRYATIPAPSVMNPKQMNYPTFPVEFFTGLSCITVLYY